MTIFGLRSHPRVRLALIAATILLESAALFAAEGARKVSIAWRPVDKAVKYQLQLSASAEMDPLLLSHEFQATNGALQLKPGTYFFRVRGFDSAGAPGPWSDVEGFVVNPAPPVALAPADRALVQERLPEKGLAFRWRSGLRGTNYLLEVRDRKGRALKRNVIGTGFDWMPPAAGSYAWRVGFEGASGEEWGRWRRFQVIQSALPPTPDELARKAAAEAARIEAEARAKAEARARPKLVDLNELEFQRELLRPRKASWSIIGRLAQSVVAYNVLDRDADVSSGGSGVVGFVSSELRWQGGKDVGQRWTWSGALNFEMIRQNVLNKLFSMPRFYGRLFYAKESGQLRAGPFIQASYGKSGIFIVQGEAEAKTAKVTRESVGAGYVVVYRPTPRMGLSVLGSIRLDMGGDASVLPNPLLSSMGYEAGFGMTLGLNSRIFLEGRLRLLEENLKWRPAIGGEPSYMRNVYILLDGGIGYRF
jgi:hypothetical protein